jgi:predicted nucleotidyltransferase
MKAEIELTPQQWKRLNELRENALSPYRSYWKRL